jgi:hypothetical protein
MTTGKIDKIGMWTWGGRIYNWKMYLDNMEKEGMNTIVLWHDKVPAAAREIKEYAAACGIEVIWGFNWGWNTPVCLNSAEDANSWAQKVMKVLEEEYIPLDPAGIYYQVGGTEFGGACRLDCSVCKKAAAEGLGPLFVKFSNVIIKEIKRAYPQIPISAGIHMGGMHQSYTALKELDSSVQIMWEDLPGPQKRIEVPFAYDWDPDKASVWEHGPAVTDTTLEMVKTMCALRGADEDVAFVIKGFPCHWGGQEPMLLESFDLKALSTIYQPVWDRAARYCEKRLDDALKVFRIIAAAPARKKTVTLLVEHGLWEFKREYAAVLITEALHDPYRGKEEIIASARAKMEA